MYEIKGEVANILRANGKTEVLVDEGVASQTLYTLDEALIDFGAACEGRDWEKYERLEWC